ncbi:hypothetical protein ACFQAS_06945 [Halopenitus salinus]|jgi:hypothetical protein|uniref:HEAT repeat domain-containing protein n=1 Tax=Halopenitus salinus TaxID=1198295 RepID=A0ABD5UV96_9EURY
MSTPVADRESLETHLLKALENTKDPEARYHIRESLQKLQIE